MQQLKSNNIKFFLVLFLGIFLIGFQKIVAQNLAELTKEDTIYYYFKHKKNETFRGLKVYTPPNLMNMEYFVRLKKINQAFYFTYFKHRKGKEDSIINIPPVIKSKKFLRLNKDKILTYCNIKKYTLKDVKEFYWENRKKVIYIIDKKDSNKKQIFLKKVSWSSSFPIEQ